MKDLAELGAAGKLAAEGVGQGTSTLGHSAHPDPWMVAQRREGALRMAIDVAVLSKRSGKKAPIIETEDILDDAARFLKFIEG